MGAFNAQCCWPVTCFPSSCYVELPLNISHVRSTPLDNCFNSNSIYVLNMILTTLHKKGLQYAEIFIFISIEVHRRSTLLYYDYGYDYCWLTCDRFDYQIAFLHKKRKVNCVNSKHSCLQHISNWLRSFGSNTEQPMNSSVYLMSTCLTIVIVYIIYYT